MRVGKTNKTILLTFDYELFLKESGSLEKCLVNPTEILRKTLNKHNIKVTFFVDILYYYRLLQFPELDSQALRIKQQIQDMVTDGHDVQLHLHPQWIEAVYQNEQWIFPDLKTYSLQQLPEEQIDELFRIGVDLLKQICCPIRPDYKVTSFRAGGLCITPFDKIRKSFQKHNIIIDSSVARGLKADTTYQKYNFLNAPDKDYYRFEDTPLIANYIGSFTELPISVYNISFSDKIRSRFYKKYNDEPFSKGEGKSLSPSAKGSQSIIKKIIRKLFSYKMPFSLEYVQPDFVVHKIVHSNRKVFTFLSHNKFVSPASLKIIERLAEMKFKFITIEEFHKCNLNNKTLILITGHFPYLVDEGYLKEEVILLSKVFKSIIIVTQDIFSKEAHLLPSNCRVYRVNSTLTKSELIYGAALSLFDLESYLEIKDIFKTYKRIPNRRILIDLFTVICSGKKIYKYIDEVIKEEKLLSEDLIVYSYWLDKCAYSVARLIRAKKVKTGISRAHSYDIYLWRNQNNYLPLRRYFYMNLTHIYFISEHGKNYFKKLLKIKNENSFKLRISKLGVSNNSYLFKKFSIEKGDKRVFNLVSCSYIMPIKRIKEIIEALALIDKISINWVHIGDGSPFEDYANEVVKLAHNLLINKENIKYQFVDKLHYDDLLKYYSENNVDLFINVSRTEGLPVSIMEAMSFGIPVIATSVGGTPEIVNNLNGILLPEDPKPKDIAQAIEKLYGLTDIEFNAYRENAYNTWKEKFNSEQNYWNFAQELSRY